MAKTVVLVDTENIGGEWSNILSKLSKADEVILFYTANSRNVSIEDLQMVIPYAEKIRFIECELGVAGRNALDFQLVSYLGYLLKSATKTRFIIYSNDTGFEPVASFWKKKDRNVERMGRELLPEYRESYVKAVAKDERALVISDDLTSDDFTDVVCADAVIIKTTTDPKQGKTKAELKQQRKALVKKALGHEPKVDEFARIGNIMAKSCGEDRDKFKELCVSAFGDKWKTYYDALFVIIDDYTELI